MPATKDPFTTVIDRGKSATVIRKGSKYAGEFDKRRGGAMQTYQDLDRKQGNALQDAYPAADNAIKRRAADTVAANVLGDTLRAKADARGRGRPGYGTNFNLSRR